MSPCLLESETLLDALDMAALVLDPQLRISAMNAEAERLLRCSQAHALGRLFTDLRPEAQGLAGLCSRAAAERRPMMVRDMAWKDPGGENYLDARVSPVHHQASGALRGFVVLLEDRSLAHDAEASLQAGEQLATLASFSAGIAHEVKNPLGGIRGAAQIIRRQGGLEPQAAECADLIIRETDRIARLVDSLMAFTRPGESLPAQRFNIHQAIDEALGLVEKEFAGRRGAAIERFYDPSLPLVQGHFDGLKQCLINLARNGLEAMEGLPEDALRALTVTTRYQSRLRRPAPPLPQGPALVIEVRDRGTGLAPGADSESFKPFRTTKPKGVGLGLAISQKIVHDHQGRLQLKNAPGGGAAAVLTLPLAAQPAQGSEAR